MSQALPHLIYLHGFLSSPASKKAQETLAWMQAQGLAWRCHCPELLPAPTRVMAQLHALVASLDGAPFAVVGSSLGGFYATWLAEEYGARAVLINPAVRPYALLQDYIGPQRNYQTGEIQVVEADFADALRAMERQPAEPARYWLLLQTGDEVLDYRQAVEFYAGCRQTVIEGGDHSFVGYADWLSQIGAFALSQA